MLERMNTAQHETRHFHVSARGYYGTELRYGTAGFWQKVRYGITYGIFRKSTVRYGNTVLYFLYRTVHFSYSSNGRFALFLPSTALFFLTYNFYHVSCAHLSPPVTPHNFKQQYCEQAELLCHNYNSIVQS